jgi:hypothetical protein
MARFKYSGVAITGGSGRLNSPLGGTVLLKNGVVRNYVTPTNPQTPGQASQRAIFSAAVSAWNITLTEAQRVAYNDAAASGEWNRSDTLTGSSKFPSGQSLFIQLYLNVSSSGGTVSDIYDVPTKEEMGDYILDGTGTASGTTGIEYNYTGTPGTNVSAVVFATPTLSAGKSVAPGGSFRKIGVISSFTSSPEVIGPLYTAKFGSIASDVGKKIFLKVEMVNTDTGQRILGGTATLTVTA